MSLAPHSTETNGARKRSRAPPGLPEHALLGLRAVPHVVAAQAHGLEHLEHLGQQEPPRVRRAARCGSAHRIQSRGLRRSPSSPLLPREIAVL